MNIFKSIVKSVWKLYKRCTLPRHITIHKNVAFNQRTELGGYNVINSGTWINNAKIGRNTYIGHDCCLLNVEIGRYCSFGNNIKVVQATHPSHTFVSTAPVFFSPLKQSNRTFADKSYFDEIISVNGRSVIIGNDVWIGDNVTIKGGITIGDGAIIAMGSVVTKDVQPYSIVGGLPAKIIRFRFDEEQIEKLLQFRWWDKDDLWLQNNYKNFHNIDRFITIINNG